MAVSKFFVVAALCGMFALASASDVVDTTDATFDDVINSNDFVLMEFYAPWCGHCKKLVPEWEKAATDLKGTAVVAKMDATAETSTPAKFDVKGYPTIKVFRGGKLAGDYEGARSADAIVKYVKGNSGPAVTEVADADALETLKKENSVVVALFGEANEAFTATANKLRASYKFVSVANAGSETAGSVVVFKQFDEPREAFTGELSEETLTEFIKSSGMRLFDEIGPENYKMYVERALPMGWLFVTPGADGADAAKTAVENVAKTVKGKMSLVWIDAAKYGGMAQRLGLKGDKFPAFAIDKEGTHYAFDETAAIDEASIQKFVDDFLNGNLAQTVRSEPAPEEHTKEGLTTVVGDTFEALVTNADVDVLIEFYAPWCGHCKQLAPVFAKVAKAAADHPVRIAHIDATANDFPQKTFAVQGFPTIFWVPKGGEPTNYDGDRSFEGFAKFLKEKASITISE